MKQLKRKACKLSRDKWQKHILKKINGRWRIDCFPSAAHTYFSVGIPLALDPCMDDNTTISGFTEQQPFLRDPNSFFRSKRAKANKACPPDHAKYNSDTTGRPLLFEIQKLANAQSFPRRALETVVYCKLSSSRRYSYTSSQLKSRRSRHYRVIGSIELVEKRKSLGLFCSNNFQWWLNSYRNITKTMVVRFRWSHRLAASAAFGLKVKPSI